MTRTVRLLGRGVGYLIVLTVVAAGCLTLGAVFSAAAGICR